MSFLMVASFPLRDSRRAHQRMGGRDPDSSCQAKVGSSFCVEEHRRCGGAATESLMPQICRISAN
jgi:hypothetical protein